MTKLVEILAVICDGRRDDLVVGCAQEKVIRELIEQNMPRLITAVQEES